MNMASNEALTKCFKQRERAVRDAAPLAERSPMPQAGVDRANAARGAMNDLFHDGDHNTYLEDGLGDAPLGAKKLYEATA